MKTKSEGNSPAFFSLEGFDVGVDASAREVMLVLHQNRLPTVPPVQICSRLSAEDAQHLAELLSEAANQLRTQRKGPGQAQH